MNSTKDRMTKDEIIKEVVAGHNIWKSAYGYILGEDGSVIKTRIGSGRRTVYATAEEVKACLKMA